MDNKALEEILKHPTTTVPLAGKAIADLSKNGSYLAAARGEIHTIKVGKRLAVPTAWIRQKLMLDKQA